MHLFFLFALILHATARITLLDGNKSVVTVPTFDFFEHRQTPYNVTGVAYYISLFRDPETQLCKAVAPPAFSSTNFTQSFQQTVIYAVFGEAYKCGIDTISQLFDKAHEMVPLLKEAGYPPSSTLVIFMGELYDGAIGCPMREPYSSRDISVPDVPPPPNVNVALVGGQHVMKILKVFGNNTLYAFNVVQETDPWNELFLSFGYTAFNWCSIAIYFAAVVIALKTSLEVYRKQSISIDLRNMVLWMAILAALSIFYSNTFLVNIATLFMGHETYLRKNLELIGDFLCYIMFFALLYLWSNLFMKISPSYTVYVLQAVIVFSALLSVTFSVHNFLLSNQIYYSPTMKTIREITVNAILPTQCLLAVISVSFGKF